MSIHGKVLVISLLAILMMCVIVEVHSAAAQTNAEQTTLNTTSIAIDQAFNGVLAAEKAGANVTGLLNKLNNAVKLLANAENAHRNGNITAVEENSDAAVVIARQVTSAAQIAKEDAQVSRNNTFWLTAVLTVIGIIVLVLVLFIVWRFIRRSHRKNPNELNLR